MAQQNIFHYPVGGDPRTLADFISIKEELSKLHHPARPDVDWQYAQTLCLALFNQNGADLQTAAWYTHIRVQQAELVGLNEGLAIINDLVTQHWQAFWPHQTHVRVDILAQLGQRVMNNLRGFTAVYTDLPLLYQIEAQLTQICLILQKLELKHLSQFERISTFIQNTARRLENLDNSDSALSTIDPLFNLTSMEAAATERKTTVHLVHKSTPAEKMNSKDPQPNSLTYSQTPYEAPAKPPIKAKSPAKIFWQGVLTGSSVCLLIVGTVFIGWRMFYASDAENSPLVRSLPSLPTFNDTAEQLINQTIFTENGSRDASTNGITEKQRENFAHLQTTLTSLMQVSPIWSQQYANQLITYLEKQGADIAEVKTLSQEWQSYLQVNATSAKSLQSWSQGMAQLAMLSQRLDQLDGKPKSYITGSELKSIIYAARRHFNEAIPLEEQLRLLEEVQQQGDVPTSEYQQIDNHFMQLLNRYALIRQEQK